MSVQIVSATSAAEIEAVRELFLEYWHFLRFDPSFQDFSAEVTGLPGKYAPPEGRLALALADRLPAGCIAFRRVDETRCEAKRLYVRTQFRQRGIGRTLLRWLIVEARNAGYRELVGDTMPFMTAALLIYRNFGFEPIAAYTHDPTPGAIYLSLNLERQEPATLDGRYGCTKVPE